MKKKIFKYFACMIAVAIVVTTVLLSWVNYGMFKNRVMDDLRTYGRVFSRILPDDEGTEEEESLARLTKEGLRVTLIHPDGSVYFDNFADLMTMENHGGRPEIRDALESGAGLAKLKAMIADFVQYDLHFMRVSGVLNALDAPGEADYDEDEAFEFIYDAYLSDHPEDEDDDMLAATLLDRYMELQADYWAQSGLSD